MLSGEQLVTLHSKTNHELPTSGPKEFQPTKSWLEQKQIQTSLDDRKSLLEEERVEKWSSLMLAEWDPAKGKARVTRTNKCWEVFGHHSDDCDWLFPEEVLYLLEMNSVECMYGGVPLSIERGYSLMLGPESGCSVNEYRVFAHLSRAGYRVTRHLPDLTVTAYERQIRLDQHLDQRQTYPLVTDPPELPPKTLVQLLPDKEVLIESKPEVKTEQGCGKQPLAVKIDGKIQKEIEVIDLLDSSSSSSSEEDSYDSDIEVIHDSGPVVKMETDQNISESEEEEEEEDDDDDDVEIIEVPQTNIIVGTINSDSEPEQNGSGSDRSYDGNFKRNQVTTTEKNFTRPDSIKLTLFKCLSVEEFCRENNLPSEANKDGLTINGEFLSLEPSLSKRDRSTFNVIKSRRDVLDLMPTMAGKTKKLMTLEVPDLSLIPDAISPRQDLYTFNTNALRARLYSSFRGRFRRGFRGPWSPWPNNSLYQNSNPSRMFPNQPIPLIHQAQALHSMLGGPSGLIQAASALVQLAQGAGTGFMPGNRSLMPNIPQPGLNNFDYSQDRIVPFQNHGRSNPGRLMIEDDGFHHPNARNNRFCDTSSGLENDFDTNQRSPIPYRNEFPNRSRIPFGRRRRRFGRNLKPRPLLPVKTENPSFPSDPAYSRPDVPLGITNTPSDGILSFIPIATSKQASVVIDITNTDSTGPASKSIGMCIMNKKRKKRMNKKLNKAKRLCNSGSSEIIFIDSPNTTENITSNLDIKSEFDSESKPIIKQENVPNILNQAANNDSPIIKREIKTEANENSSQMKDKDSALIRVKEEQNVSGENLRVDVKQERPNETSSTDKNLSPVDTEHQVSVSVKQEPVVDVHDIEKSPVRDEAAGKGNEVALSDVPVSLVQISNEAINPNSVEVQAEKEINDETGNLSSNDSTESKTIHIAISNETSSNSLDLVPTMNVDSASKPTDNNTQTKIINPVLKEGIVSEISIQESSKENKQDKLCKDKNGHDVGSSSSSKLASVISMEVDDSSNTLDESSQTGTSEVVVEKETLICSQMEVESLGEIVQDKETEGDFTVLREDISIVCENLGSYQSEKSDKVCEIVGNTSNVHDLPNEVHFDKRKSTVGNNNISESLENITETKENAAESKNENRDLAKDNVKLGELQTGFETSRGVKDGGNVASTSEICKLDNHKEASSWEYIKKHNVPLSSVNNVEEETTSSLEEEEENNGIMPLIKPKHCKTIGSVLSALQIFSPITVKVPEDTPKLNISFDMYKALDFRKSQRGLPHYRIVVFCGSEPIPSACQLWELQRRFSDGVPVLRAVVTAQSVVFYSATDICLPVDDTSYKR